MSRMFWLGFAFFIPSVGCDGSSKSDFDGNQRHDGLEVVVSCTPAGGDCVDAEIGCCEELVCNEDTGHCENPTCFGDGWGCEIGGLACCEGVCLDAAYGMGECGPPRAANEWCMHNHECESAACVDYQCQAAATVACVDDQSLCEVGGAPCCEGVCLEGAYGASFCGPARANGEYCWRDQDCLSGDCGDDYRCTE